MEPVSIAALGGLTEELALLAVFAAVATTVLGAWALVDRQAGKRRLTAVEAGMQGPSLRFGGGILARWLPERMHESLLPAQPADRSAVRRRLMQAGFYAPNAVLTYYVARLILSVGLPLCLAVLAPLLPETVRTGKVVMAVIGLGVGGYLLPVIYISNRCQRRQTAYREGFPDALDMLLVCVEAGLGLDAAISRVGEEIGKAHPLLGEQFRLMGIELRAGKSREEALRNFSDRIGIDEVSSLCSLLIQTETLGTSMADALRVHADDMRAKRLLRAEAKAQELGVKLSFPLIMFILPTLMVFIMTPIVIQVIRVVLPTMRGIGR